MFPAGLPSFRPCRGHWAVRVEPPSWRPWWGRLIVSEDGGYRVIGRHGCYPVRVRVTGRGWRWVPAVGDVAVRVRLEFAREGAAVPGWLYWEGR